MPEPHLGREFSDVLVESIDEALTSILSRAVVDALYNYLQRIHSISKDEAPSRIDILSTALEKLFGASGQTLTKAIPRKFYIELGLEFTGDSNRTLLDYVNEAKTKLQNSSSK